MRTIITMLSIALAATACTTDDTTAPSLTPDAPEAAAALRRACGEYPSEEPPFHLTKLPGTGGIVCMPDDVYISRDLHLQALRDWAVCVEIELCRMRGECDR